MKKILSFIIIFISPFFMSSCFLFKPVQKTCPAYSLNISNDVNTDLTLKSNDKLTNETSM